MKTIFLFRASIYLKVAIILLLSFGHAVADPWMGRMSLRDDLIWPNGRPMNYGVVKYFLDENTNESVPINVQIEVNADGRSPSDLEVQLFSNINRRDFAKVYEPATAAGMRDSFWLTYPMSYKKSNGNFHIYQVTVPLTKTGAYRVTARFRIQGGPWLWHNQFQYDGMLQRDGAVVVSPKKALDRTIYEVNTMVVEAMPSSGVQRSTLDDFTDHDIDGYDPFNLAVVRNQLGFNTLWLMPIFPITQIRYDENLGHDVPNISPGSPYSTRNYFAVNGLFDETGNQDAAMDEFVYFVNKAEQAGLDVFIDVAYNHSGRDTVFGQGAVNAGLVPPSDADTRIQDRHPAWATNKSNYRDHAHAGNQWALYAPTDRLGEHRWLDAGLDWYFGNYSSLGPKPGLGDTTQGGTLDERDQFYTDFDPEGGYDYEVENVWNYFASIIPFWLDKTGNRLDGIRADFAQGLPPQAWEYIINKARQKKWDFIFLAEVLDPDIVRYRTNRHFDVVTTVDHWLYRSNDVTMSQLVGSLENEERLYGYNAAVLHNGTSHDEQGNGNIWLMAARYAVASTVYGMPMVYMSQPLGIPYKVNFESSWENIKNYWDAKNPDAIGMYGRINTARAQSQALRSTNRYFLHKKNGNGFNEGIFSVARWSSDDIVLAFINLRGSSIGSETYAIPPMVPLDSGVGIRYQAFNMLADNPNQPLWPHPRSAADIRANGVYVALHLPNESQYLQLRKVP